jgi:hypothetical protein
MLKLWTRAVLNLKLLQSINVKHLSRTGANLELVLIKAANSPHCLSVFLEFPGVINCINVSLSFMLHLYFHQSITFSLLKRTYCVHADAVVDFFADQKPIRFSVFSRVYLSLEACFNMKQDSVRRTGVRITYLRSRPAKQGISSWACVDNKSRWAKTRRSPCVASPTHRERYSLPASSRNTLCRGAEKNAVGAY